MDTETQPTPPTQENGPKIEESSSDPPGEVTNAKEELKISLRVTRQTRSRSRTPQKPKEKKSDDNAKSKKDESKASPLSPTNSEQCVNGHSENRESLETKENQKDEENPKEQENVRKLRSSDSKNTTEEKKDSPKKADIDVAKKETQGSVDREADNKKDNLKQKVLNDDSKKPSAKEVNILEPENSVQSNDLPKQDGESVDMDPLVLATDEPDPELQFDENSDLESGKGSPMLRCKTRRSHTRNIPTPKTPKSTDSESEKNSMAPTPTPENLNDTNDSATIGDISTKAEVGSDVTRLDYVASNTSFVSDDNSYLSYSRDKSLRESLRSLSPRKPIRPINDSYRQRAFKNSQNKSDLNTPYSEHDSFARISGVKRRRSITPEDRKKFKPDSTGFGSYWSSPLNNLKNKFMGDVNSSTPKLTGYRDSSKDIREDINYTEEVISDTDEKRNWCAIM